MAEPRPSAGTFVWRELMTEDVEGARRFYGELFGWSWKGEEMGGDGTYWIASRGAQQVCGMMGKPPGVPMPSAWSSYALVDDVDATARRWREAGGQVLKPPDDIPNVGRFAFQADPWGAVLPTFHPAGHEEQPRPPRPPPATFCWESLVTPDPAGAIAFYGKVIGYATVPTPGGEGKMFAAGGNPVADVQTARPGGPSYWATYVLVEDAEGTRDRAARLGGKVLVPRMDVPKVGIVSVVADPAGAALGIFQPAA